MKRIEDLLDMPIVTVAEGRKLGKLKSLEIDVQDGHIAYLRFTREGSRNTGILPWARVRALGRDAITVESLEGALDTIPHGDLPHLTEHVGDRPVVTESGRRLGTISGYDVDETSGRIVSYRLPDSGFLGRLTGSEVQFGHEDIVSFGKDAIVVSDRVCALPREHQRAA